MAISDRVLESIRKYEEEDYVNALIQLCIAIDATAKKEFPKSKKVGDRFKKFIRSNLDIVTFAMFGDILPEFREGEDTIETFTYKVLRCGLLHEGELSERFEVVDTGEQIMIGGNSWRVPKTFLFGLTLAVVGAKSNSRESVPIDFGVTWVETRFRFNDLWGNSAAIRAAIKPSPHMYMLDLNALQTTQ